MSKQVKLMVVINEVVIIKGALAKREPHDSHPDTIRMLDTAHRCMTRNDRCTIDIVLPIDNVVEMYHAMHDHYYDEDVKGTNPKHMKLLRGLVSRIVQAIDTARYG